MTNIKRRQRYFIVIVCLFSLTVIIMSFQTSIRLTEANDTLTELTQRLDEAREENRILTVRFESLYTLDKIEQYASDVLGMVGRSVGQTVYIDRDKT